ncbi:MAG: nucleoside recognition domain-containing protein [Lachnospiraceae bacterium]|nr:nucleoside recognition domain-containing protein [Lachnospiraceae bacterium]
MEKATTKDMIKFAVLSIIGVFLYFIPVDGSRVPVVIMVSWIKGALGDHLKYLVLLALVILMGTIIGAKFLKNPTCIRLHEGDTNTKLIHYALAFFVVLAVWFQLPPAAIFSNEQIGGQILGLAGTVMLTVSVCGWFIVFILKSGIVEFVGGILECLMRPLLKLPGAAAVNCLSSYVVSAAVGVYMTDQYYENKTYTQREAVAAATCFSTISVGYIGVLCSIGGIENMYGTLLALTFGLVFVMTVILVRIPPISRVPNVYIDGSSPADQSEKTDDGGSRFQNALNAAAIKSRQFTAKAFLDSLFSALKFSQRIIAYMIPIVIVTLTIVHLTPLFTWLGKPIAPILGLLGLPDAGKIAPAVLLGFIEVSLPVISVSSGVALQSVFFVVELSIMQIIFMTEAGNAMLGAKIPLKFTDLLLHFVVRTVIAVPIIALISHLLF